MNGSDLENTWSVRPYSKSYFTLMSGYRAMRRKTGNIGIPQRRTFQSFGKGNPTFSKNFAPSNRRRFTFRSTWVGLWMINMPQTIRLTHTIYILLIHSKLTPDTKQHAVRDQKVNRVVWPLSDSTPFIRIRIARGQKSWPIQHRSANQRLFNCRLW